MENMITVRKGFIRFFTLILIIFVMMGLVEVYAASNVIQVKLEEGESAAVSNLIALNDAFAHASNSKNAVVKIKAKGTYYVGGDSKTTSLRIRSNTTFDLNGSTIVRGMSMGNLIQNVDIEGNKDKGGYSLSENITIRNGTLDGNSQLKVKCNLVIIGHAENITFDKIAFTHALGGHLIELTGVKKATIKNCSFDGYLGSKDAYQEAVQIDIAHMQKENNQKWNGVYKLDDTVCKDILVSDCTFYDYPGGVGNHHTLYGNHCSNIVIRNNKFCNTKFKEGCAIGAYAFDDCRIYNNTIVGKYDSGIILNAGTGLVRNNIIGAEHNYFRGTPIYITLANSYTDSGKGSKIERASDVSIISNKVYSDCEDGSAGILVLNGCEVDEVIGNVIHMKHGDGVRVSGKGTLIKKLGKDKKGCGNYITSSKANGIVVTNYGCASEIVYNKIDKVKLSAVEVRGSSYAKKITNNKFTNCGLCGIRVMSNSKFKSITNNFIKYIGTYGIYYKNPGARVTVNKNTIKKCGKKHVRVKAKGKIQKK